MIKRRWCTVDSDAGTVIRCCNGEGPRAFGLAQGAQLNASDCTPGSREDDTMPHILTGRTVVAGAERVEWIADAVHIVEEFAEDATPRLRFGVSVIGDQAKACIQVSLQMHQKPVVTGSVVRVEHIDVRNKCRLPGIVEWQ